MEISTKISFLQRLGAIVMVLALSWLTISAPFVFATMQELAETSKTSLATPLENEEASTAFGNTTEEKTPGGSSSFSEEYIHDHHISDYFFIIASQFHYSGNSGTYIAFHGELTVPPPEAI